MRCRGKLLGQVLAGISAASLPHLASGAALVPGLTALGPCRQELGNGARAAKWNVVSWACGPGWRVNILKISVGSVFQTVTQIREVGANPYPGELGSHILFPRSSNFGANGFP